MKKTSIIIIFSLFFLSGCGLNTVKREIVTVKVPVEALIGPPPELSTPLLPIYELDINASYDDTVKAYVNSILILENHIRQLEVILDGYR